MSEPASSRLAEREERELQEYVARIVAAAPPLSECPPEAEAAIRALGNATHDHQHRKAS
ncbi:MAG TPA: hypothetical protein VIP06_02835 [Nocardioides sp.]